MMEKGLNMLSKQQKTSKDSYITALIMENKLVTKDILRKII